MNNLSARGIMMWSQLRNESMSGVIWDCYHGCCTDLVDLLPHRLLRRIRGACLAISQTAGALLDVCALPDETAADEAEEALRGEAAGQRLWPCASRILGSDSAAIAVWIRLKETTPFQLRYATGTAVAANALSRCHTSKRLWETALNSSLTAVLLGAIDRRPCGVSLCGTE